MHLRNRHLINVVLKKRLLFPLVGTLGIRQTGKSTVFRDFIAKKEGIAYFTLDRPEILRALKLQPEAFLRTETDNFAKPIIIDEAQKAPGLFDLLKVLADEEKRRGMIFLTGSVDFSKVFGVREALTGRIGITKLFPFTVSELKELPYQKAPFDLRETLISRSKSKDAEFSKSIKDISRYLERGGMPTVCRISDKDQRDSIKEELLQALCYRDLQQLKGARYDGAIARELLSLIARNPQANKADLAREMSEDSRTIEKHLRGLEALFAIYRISSFTQGSREDRFSIWDAGFCRYLGGDDKTCLKSFIINEVKAASEYHGLPEPGLSFYASRGLTKVDLIVASKLQDKVELLPLVLSDRDSISSSQLLSLNSLISTNKFSEIFVVTPTTQGYKLNEKINVIPQCVFAF